MKTLLNIIWLVLSGFWMALGYAVAGVIMCVLIITIPFGIQAFKLAGYALWPFGRTVVKRPSAGGGSVIGNVLWLVLCGWWLAVGHLVTAVPLALTIIGLPLAYANVKLIPISLWPFGREVVPAAEVEAALGAYRAESQQAPLMPPPVTAPPALDPPPTASDSVDRPLRRQ